MTAPRLADGAWLVAEAILRSGDSTSPLRLRSLVATTCLFGLAYGAVMGCYGARLLVGPLAATGVFRGEGAAVDSGVVRAERAQLLRVQFDRGSVRDFPAALRALAAAQSSMAIVLAARAAHAFLVRLL